MTKQIIGTALAFVLGAGVAFAQETEEDRVMVNVDGQMVETSVEKAAEACGMEAEAVQAQAGNEIAVCEIDQATADEHEIAEEAS